MTQQISSERIILVTGATGNQGGAVARHLLQRGNFKVRAFVRDPNKPAAQTLQQAGAELAVGVLNPNSLQAAMSDQQAVISSLGSKLSFKPMTLLSEGTKNLVQAMQQHGHQTPLISD